MGGPPRFFGEVFVIFLLVGLFVSLGFVYVLLVRNKRLNKENRLLQRQYEAVDNALFRMEEMQKTYLLYENMKKCMKKAYCLSTIIIIRDKCV